MFVALSWIARRVGHILLKAGHICVRGGRYCGDRANEWYWSLDARRRHTVGWSALILLLCLLGTSLWGIGLGAYHACRWVGEWWNGDSNAMEVRTIELAEEEDVTSLDWYSGDYKHRKFPCGELNPKRKLLYYRAFKDINDVPIVAARRLGVPPLPNREAIEKYKGKRLIHLKNTRFYQLDPMTHSSPYLVPDAADFLTALGQRWQAYHGTNSRFVITSCLRTDADIKRLRRGNVNATKTSCHRYGTTIDITYNRFDRHGNVRYSKLKEDLARALYDMRDAGHCYVKYEHQQACFHITVRPR